MQDVVIVGGGPVGLWLAGELALGGATVTVPERRDRPDPHSKALTLHPRTLEILACRGEADRFLAEGLRIPSGHFGALEQRLDFRALDTPYPFTLLLPQVRTEELFEQRARALGVTVLREHTVRRLDITDDGVEVHADGPAGPRTVAAAYVVGCDGTRSTVREAAGIAFPGTDDTAWGWLGDVVLDAPPAGGALSVSGAAGGLMVVPLPGGLHRIVGSDPSGARTGRPPALTLDELRASTRRIAGSDLGMHSPAWLSRFGNAARHAERYRAGRVLLAGDAAHMHFPAGGVGLNVGVQDAHALGWRLADVVRGRAGDAVLDDYHRERHPVGAELIESSRAQTALMTATDADGLALRSVLGGLIAAVPALSGTLAGRLSGLSVAYPVPDGAHPLVGTRAPALPLDDGDLFTALRPGRRLTLCLGDAPAPAVTGADMLRAPRPDRDGWRDVAVARIRPDGHVETVTTVGDPAPVGSRSRRAT